MKKVTKAQAASIGAAIQTYAVARSSIVEWCNLPKDSAKKQFSEYEYWKRQEERAVTILAELGIKA